MAEFLKHALRERRASPHRPHYNRRATEGSPLGGPGAGSTRKSSPTVPPARSFGRRSGSSATAGVGAAPPSGNHEGVSGFGMNPLLSASAALREYFFRPSQSRPRWRERRSSR